MFVVDHEEGSTPFDLRALIEDKIGRETDTAFGELCGVVERLASNHSHRAQREALRPLLRSDIEIRILEKP